MSESRREALRRKQQAQARAKRTQRIIIVGAIVLAVVILGVFGTIFVGQLNKGGSTAGSAATPPNATADRGGIIVNPGKAAQGAPKVEIFLDYQCPICKQFESAFGSTLDEMASKGEIELIYRTMTFLDNNLRNDSSLKAGVAAACADNVGAYSAYHNAIFAGQPTTEGQGYSTQQLRVDFPAAAGITGDALTSFQGCYDSRATQSFVQGTNEAAAAAKVTSTPTIRVNGTTLDNNTVFQSTADTFKQLILSTKGNG